MRPRVIARLEPGVSRQQAEADMAAVAATLARLYPKDNGEIGAVVMALREEVGRRDRLVAGRAIGARLAWTV